MTPGPGWYRDPYFLHHERYWDDGWTDFVRRVDKEQPALGAPTATPALSSATDAHDARARLGVAAAAVGIGAGMASRPSVPSVPSDPPKAEHHTGTIPIAIPLPSTGESPTGEAPVIHPDDTLAIPALRRDDDTIVVPPVPRDDDTATVAAIPVEPDTRSVPVIAGINGGTPHANGGPPAAASNGAAPAVPLAAPWEMEGPSADEAAAVRARARRRRRGFVAAGLVVVVVVVVAVVATRGNSSKGGAGGGATGSGAALAGTGGSPALAGGTRTGAATPSPSAAQAVTTAATMSLDKGSVVVTAAHAAPGSTQSTAQQISGSGDFNLQSGLGAFTATGPGSTSQQQRFVFQGQALYVSVTNSPVPGKTWVVATTNNLPALGPGSTLSSFMEEMGNPALLLKQLTGPSVTMASLGTSTIAAKTVHRYQATFSSDVTTLAAEGFSAATSEEVDIGADGLVKQIVIPVSVYGQSVQTSDIVVAFKHYGKLITVQIPPFDQLLSLPQYLTRPAAPSA